MSLLCKMGGRLITLWEPFSCDNTVSGAVSRVGSRGRTLPLALTLKESVTLEGAVPREGRWSSYHRDRPGVSGKTLMPGTLSGWESKPYFRREREWWESVANSGDRLLNQGSESRLLSYSLCYLCLFTWYSPWILYHLSENTNTEPRERILFSMLRQGSEEKMPPGPLRWQQQ